MDLGSGTAKGRLEVLHILLGVVGCLELGTRTHFVLLVGPVRKWHHLFVAFGKKSHGGYHPSEEASRESTSGETKHENLVSVVVVSHCETVAGDDMLVEGCAEPFVQCLGPAALEATP